MHEPTNEREHLRAENHTLRTENTLLRQQVQQLLLTVNELRTQVEKQQHLTHAALAAYRQTHATPLLNNFASWLVEHAPRVLPKSKLGEAFTYATNQWPTLTVYVTDGRFRDRQQRRRTSVASRRRGLQKLAPYRW